MNDTMPDREAYELQISLLKEQIEKIKKDTSYRKLLARNLGGIKATLELVKMPRDNAETLQLTISYLQSLNDL
jgi:hypothetical protein